MPYKSDLPKEASPLEHLKRGKELYNKKQNMVIKPTYVTFEQAKLLKAKRFITPTNHYYFEDGEFKEYFLQETHGYYGDEYEVHLSEFNENWNDKGLTKKNGDRCFGCSKDRGYFETYSAPEQWQVCEWLLQNHRLDIIIKYPESNSNKVEGINSVYYDLEIYRLRGGDAHKLYKFVGISDKKQEAYSAAFDYILDNNLIN
jgi:hypothetical protein